ncbi:MAG: LCP family protein [Candidatus Magasanikbacteria bacterium]
MEKRDINFLPTEIHQEELIKTRSPRRTIFFIVLIIALVITVSSCVAMMLSEKPVPNDPLAYDPETLEPMEPNGFFKKVTHFVLNRSDKLNGEKDDRINILLLGMGGMGHDGPFLTDTIIIASIQPSSGKIAMLSIPRDLGVDIPNHGWYKINHANAFGEAEKRGTGGELAKKVIEETFDIPIHYYAQIDFTAFSEIIDEVGGVTVDVERSFIDNQYPAPNEEFQTISFEKGIQTMDGQTALIFARSRHGGNGEGSDFARARRQQKIIFALKEKLLSFATLANPLKINNIKNSLETHISTNLQFSDIMSLLRLAKELNTTKIITTVLDDSPDGFLQNSHSPNGAFILEPKTGNFTDINTMVANIFTNIPAQTDNTPDQTAPAISSANIEIQNGTWVVGLASGIRKKLQDNGFIISSVGNTEIKPQPNSAIYKISPKANDTALRIQQELDIPIKQSLPTGVSPSTSTDVLIVIGDDEEKVIE